MAFGMGNCAIQQTFGACSILSATYLYDQYLPLTPILLALSSTCPVYKGKLTDYDNRFSLIVQGVDDRTEEEKDINSPNIYVNQDIVHLIPIFQIVNILMIFIMIILHFQLIKIIMINL